MSRRIQQQSSAKHYPWHFAQSIQKSNLVQVVILKDVSVLLTGAPLQNKRLCMCLLKGDLLQGR